MSRRLPNHIKYQSEHSALIIKVNSIADHLTLVYVPIVGGKYIPTFVERNRIKEADFKVSPKCTAYKIGVRYPHVSTMGSGVYAQIQEDFLGTLYESAWDDHIMREYPDAEIRPYKNGEFIYVQLKCSGIRTEVESITYFNSKSCGKFFRQSEWRIPQDFDTLIAHAEKPSTSIEIDYSHRLADHLVSWGLIKAPEIDSDSIDEFGEHY